MHQFSAGRLEEWLAAVLKIHGCVVFPSLLGREHLGLVPVKEQDTYLLFLQPALVLFDTMFFYHLFL